MRTRRLTLEYEQEFKCRDARQDSHGLFESMFLKNMEHYMATARDFVAEASALAAIPMTDSRFGPYWKNQYMSGLDAVSLYSYISTVKPKTYLEMGSGFSSRFVRRAIQDNKLKTHMISIDPNPRSEIDLTSNEVIRKLLGDVDYEPLVRRLHPGDVVFMDGSHHCLQNSDSTVFFTEILPLIPAGVLIGVHDIMLPNDYPEEWTQRFYSEQYLLACWLLADGGRNLQIDFPSYWLSYSPAGAPVRDILAPLWDQLPPEMPHQHGCTFWFRKIK